ncbi:MAG TPA: hypothetical protein VD913_00450, partial [bacterium]|nr:hypothetical protein [bacterium]
MGQSSFLLPDSLGRVTEFVNNPSSPDRIIIHVQTAHGQYEAQKNIEAILDFLHQNYGIKLLLLEGGSHKLRPELFRFFPQDPELNSKILEALTREAQLTGAEAFLVKASGDIQGWGVENSAAYDKNRQAFKRVIEGRPVLDKYLNFLYLAVEKAADPILNKDLKHFLRLQRASEESKISPAEWLRELKKSAQDYLDLDLNGVVSQIDWPFLVRYFRLEKIEAKIDPTKVHQETETFLRELKSLKLDPTTVEAVNAVIENRSGDAVKQINPKRGQTLKFAPLPFSTPTRSLFERLLGQLPANFSFQKYPHLRLFIQQQILLEELMGDKLYEEVSRLSEAISGQLAKTEQEERILYLLKGYSLLKKLFALELSREEYQTYFRNNDLFSPASLETALKRTLPGGVSIYFRHAADFYEGAIDREAWMMRNVSRRMEGLKVQKAVLITGGFHTEGLKPLILDSGYSYVQITPRVEKLQNNSREVYTQAILGGNSLTRSTLEPPLRTDILQLENLEPPFVQGTRRNIFRTIEKTVNLERPGQKTMLLEAIHRSELAVFFRGSRSRSEVRSDKAGEKEENEWQRKIESILNPLKSFTPVLLDQDSENIDQRLNAARRIRDAAEGASFVFSGEGNPADENRAVMSYESLAIRLIHVYMNLTPVLDDPEEMIRKEASMAFAQVGEALESGVAALLAALTSDDPAIQGKASITLGVVARMFEEQIDLLSNHRWFITRIMKTAENVMEELNLDMIQKSGQEITPVIGRLRQRYQALMERAAAYHFGHFKGENGQDSLGRSEVRNRREGKNHQLIRIFQGRTIRHLFMDYDGNYAHARQKPSKRILDLTNDLIRLGIGVDFVSSGRGAYLRDMLEGSFERDTQDKVTLAAEAGGDVFTMNSQGDFQRDEGRSLHVPEEEKQIVMTALEFTLGQLLTEKGISIPLSKDGPEPEVPHFNLKIRHAGASLTISNDMTLKLYLAELGPRVKEEIERLWIGGRFSTKPLSSISNVAVDVTFAEGGKQGWVEKRMKELNLLPDEVLVSGDSAFEGGGDEPMFRVPKVLKIYSGPPRADLPQDPFMFYTPVEGPEGVEQTLELLLEAVQARNVAASSRAEIRYDEKRLGASLDAALHETFRHYRVYRKTKHSSINTFPKTYALEIDDTGDVRIMDTENTSSPIVNLPFKKPHIYF